MNSFINATYKGSRGRGTSNKNDHLPIEGEAADGIIKILNRQVLSTDIIINFGVRTLSQLEMVRVVVVRRHCVTGM